MVREFSNGVMEENIKGSGKMGSNMVEASWLTGKEKKSRLNGLKGKE